MRDTYPSINAIRKKDTNIHQGRGDGHCQRGRGWREYFMRVILAIKTRWNTEITSRTSALAGRKKDVGT